MKGLCLDADSQAEEMESWLTTMGYPCPQIKQWKRITEVAVSGENLGVAVVEYDVESAGGQRQGSVGSRTQWMAQGA